MNLENKVNKASLNDLENLAKTKQSLQGLTRLV